MKHISKFGLVVGTIIFMTTLPLQATLVTSNQAVYASGTYRNSGGGTSSTTVLNDQNQWNQLDAGNSTAGDWAALTWANNPQDLSRLIVEFELAGTQFMVGGFNVQTAIVANPSGSNDAHWQTVQSYTSPADYPLSKVSFALSPNVTSTGIRIVRTGATTFAGDDLMRIDEVWAFSQYMNLALTASVSAPGWTSSSSLNDEITDNQAFIGATSATNTFTWAAAQPIGGVQVASGSGAGGPNYIQAFRIEAWNGLAWNTVTNITGNTQAAPYIVFANTVYTDQLRLDYFSTGGASAGDGFFRVGEVFIFADVPEPSTVFLMASGGLLLWRKRRWQWTSNKWR